MTNKKVLVEFIESIAILSDPRPTNELDRKYELYRHQMRTRPRPRSPESIEQSIEEMKKGDRYGEPAYGFPRDRSFKPGEIASIEESIARKWQACGYCEIVEQAAA